MRRLRGICLVVMIAVSVMLDRYAEGQAAVVPPAGTQPAIAKRVLIFSIDGCRPDVLLRANAPAIRGMMAEGSFTFYAETTNVAITLPSHTSMVTGVTPEKHGIDYNSDPPDDEIVYPKVPTIFDVAKKRGMSTALTSTKVKFRVLARPGAIDHMWVSKESSSKDDLGSARKAAAIIGEYKPQVMLVHFGGTDAAGHAKGWGSPEQIAAIEDADAGVGVVLKALGDAGIREETLVILSADHGGSGKSHGQGDLRSRFIPWIATGPTVRKNFDLTSDRGLTVHTEDTFATACLFLGIPLPEYCDGKAVIQVLPAKEVVKKK